MNLVAAFDGVDCTDVLVRRMLQQGAYAVPVEPAQKRAHSALFRPDARRACARRSAAESAAIAPDRPVDAWQKRSHHGGHTTIAAVGALVRLKGLEPTR